LSAQAVPQAAILLTGNELLRGVISDLNSSFLARSLERHGFAMRRSLTVGDGLDDIVQGFSELFAEHDLVVTSGGLGPTHDDRTVEAIARACGVTLVVDDDVLDTVNGWTDRVAERSGFDPERFAAGNLKQAHIPDGASVLGIAGTAPALVLEAGRAMVVVLPGVPSELRRLWPLAAEHPRLRALFERAPARTRQVLRTYGVGESHVADLFAEAGGDPPGVETSICARRFEIEVDIRADPGAEENGRKLATDLRERLGEWVFAADEASLAEIVLDALADRGWTFATAESCTGGGIAEAVTAVPGSSATFLGAVVSYANSAKHELLGLSDELLERHGSVSAEAAAAMAAGARKAFGADVAVAVTGIAGPGGGSEEKPVGLVYLHLSTPDAELGRRSVFTGDRDIIRERAVTAGLHLIRAHLGTPSRHLGA
jgi:nicotinamide-nucleotide amidase